mmetsp:Transcript_12338/g.16734  ORF Transcript_12338/g.16734 Transcript_12338/m.16734 type:complete len:86 (-) Transcript_12338:63-320(-)
MCPEKMCKNTDKMLFDCECLPSDEAKKQMDRWSREMQERHERDHDRDDGALEEMWDALENLMSDSAVMTSASALVAATAVATAAF